MSFPNVYNHRKVAETAARSCDICFKLSSSVLITPDNKDFFYICPSHLKDVGFCSPKIDKEALEARRKKELEEEVERVKKEYEEKKKKKEEKKKDDKKDDKRDDKDDKKDEKKDDKKDDEKKEDDKKDDEKKSPSPPAEEEPRTFELKPTFYQRRIQRKMEAEQAKRHAEMAKRNQQRLADPNYFPSVPKSQP
ncbi:hypothetical protein OQA88_8033 [Cercophora sp. LCS_1]